ncbi:uncharacterized protein LOC119770359 isoform X2 [Culex quinquefasciatus]|nr:uncharacterized protein LOC119766751 [Culex quinquefasciatus]XP_038121000.1 uncharacterized protein LOC119770359 isoform X2 [Culex quinquefasciatus]
MKDIKLIVPVDESVTPVVQNVRRPPIALLTRVEEKLDQLLASEIIEPVKGNKLTTTFNPTKFTVVDRSGGRVTVSDQENGKTYERNVAHLKRVVDPPADLGEQFADSDTDGEDFRGFDQIEIQEKSPPKGKRTRRCPTKFNDFVM